MTDEATPTRIAQLADELETARKNVLTQRGHFEAAKADLDVAIAVEKKAMAVFRAATDSLRPKRPRKTVKP